MGMDGFDMVSMGVGLFDLENPLVQFNQKLHSSVVYNVFQTGINALAIFTGAATTTMTCFVAGTMILTATGLVAIEKIQAGDIVISRNPETKETAEKIVVETYIREDRKLIHLVINGEEITTTETHPFYVNKKGFVEAGKLKPGEELVDVNNNIVKIEEYSVEITKEPTPVYNFQVEDFHTYFVGETSVLVHNECNLPTKNSKNFVNRTDNKDGSVTITKMIDAKKVSVKYTRAENGNLYPRFELYAHPDYPNPIKINFKF